MSKNAAEIMVTHRFECVKSTVIRMMSDRGYNYHEETKFKNQKNLTIIAKRSESSEEKDKIYIFFSLGAKIGVEEFKKFENLLEEENIRHMIILTNEGLTPQSSSKLQHLKEIKKQNGITFNVEILTYNKFIRNPTFHEMNKKKRRKLSDEEKRNLLEKYHLNNLQIPIIFTTDIICQYYGYPIGSVIETEKSYGSIGPGKTYRIVTENPNK